MTNQKVKNFFVSNGHIKEAIYQLFSGFARCYTSVNNHCWSCDLAVQYEAVILCTKSLIENSDYSSIMDRMKLIQELLEASQQTYRHISQGSRIFFDIPGAGLPYTGSYKRVIWTYYGIVKMLIKMAYYSKRNSEQAEIIPILNFSSVPVIKSKSYDFARTASEDGKTSKSKLVVFTLPYAALCNIPRFTGYLVHELHHYFAPADRYTRNKILGSYFMAFLLGELLYSACAVRSASKSDSGSKSDDDSEQAHILSALQGVSLEYVLTHYSEIMSLMSGDSSTERAASLQDYSSLAHGEWRDYAEAIIQFFSDLTCGNAGKTESNPYGFLRSLESYIQNNGKELIEKRYRQAAPAFADFACFRTNLFDKMHDSLEIFNQTSELRIQLSNTLEGALEACCDYYMVQIWSPNDERQAAFIYLDYVADYLFARQKILSTSDGLEVEYLSQLESDLRRGQFFARLGMMLDHFIGSIQKGSVSEQIKDAADDIAKVEALLSEWVERNKMILNTRVSEKRNTLRVKSRIKLDTVFRHLYHTYRDYMQFRPYLHKLLLMTDFDYVSHAFFQEPDSNTELFSRAVKIHEFAESFFGIQTSGKNKADRALELMDLHAELIEFYSLQPTLVQMRDLLSERQKVTNQVAENVNHWFQANDMWKPSQHAYTFEYDVYTDDEFFKLVTRLLSQISNGKKSTELWFRGQESAKYKLNPSLYRTVSESDKKLNGEMFRIQQHFYDQFLARGSHFSEIERAEMSTDIDWLSAMQHYSVPTNLLDWSETLFTGMYFMLESLILEQYSKNKKNLEIERKAKQTREEGASLYIFNPSAYNKAWRQYFENRCKDNQAPGDGCVLCGRREAISSYYIPNLSTARAVKDFSAYVLGDMEIKKCCKQESITCKECPIQYPIAIVTGQSNIRLRRQAGTFVAFSLHKFGDAADATLENVQNTWVTSELLAPLFLYKINVHGMALDELAKWMIQAGMRTFRFYPELERVGNDIIDFMKEQ